MKRELTCIVCPLGCALTAEVEDGQVTEVSGNTCPRGEDYARRECVCPMRVLTSTALTEDGQVVSVRTDRAVPKDALFECMAEVNRLVLPLPIRIGSVIINRIAGTDANLIATKNMERGIPNGKIQ